MGPMTSAAKTDTAQEPADWAAAAEARVLAEALKLAPGQGWAWAMTRMAGAAAGFSRGETELLLPGGPLDLAALHSRACDDAALAALAATDPASLKIRERIRLGASARIDAAMASEAATRRWAGFLALPGSAALGLRLVWESADAIWNWAGDTATDENHYSKRALLAGILTSTLLVRLSQGEAAAAATLDRRIEAVMAFERFKGRIGKLKLGQWTAGALGRARYGGLRG
jgi:ubiquinone biosynthesis protein COQ9